MMKTIFTRLLSKKKTAVLAVMALGILMLTAVAVVAQEYTTKTKPSLKLNKASFVGTALTSLASNAVGAALTLETDSQDPSSTPLSLKTETSSQAPMAVNSETKVNKLNADKIDSKEATAFLPSSIYRKLENVTDTCNPQQTACVTPSRTITCNTGDQAIGGGFGAVDAGTTILNNNPSSSTGTDITGWLVSWQDDSTKDTFNIYVVCADF